MDAEPSAVAIAAALGNPVLAGARVSPPEALATRSATSAAVETRNAVHLLFGRLAIHGTSRGDAPRTSREGHPIHIEGRREYQIQQSPSAQRRRRRDYIHSPEPHNVSGKIGSAVGVGETSLRAHRQLMKEDRDAATETERTSGPGRQPLV